jgi:APA family basic amino acid/polyamine antiporter
MRTWMAAPEPPRRLRREVGVLGAMLLGLGSIIGTGVFVSLGIAAGVAGPAVVLALAGAAGVALCNGLSSAQLAASNPVSGGTYEYGYRYLSPSLGFLAGWTFLCAKSASAATAALGFAGYSLSALGQSGPTWLVPLALSAVAVLTGIVLTGIRHSSAANGVIVSVTLCSLVFFVGAGLPTALTAGAGNLTPFFGVASAESSNPLAGFLEACALMFVAYTGYGRIATLGEEIREPERSIPRTILGMLLVTMALYIAVGLVGVCAVGAEAFGRAGTVQAAPLEVVARQFGGPWAGLVLAVGAVTAMMSVLLNLILGLSRVVLAMGRRSDLPSIFGRLDRSGRTPAAAVILVGLVIAGLALIGSVKTTWSFSAFTVLIYYALTNLCALRLSASERRYPRFVPWLGLATYLFLAVWVEATVWVVGLGLLAAGLLWHLLAKRGVKAADRSP